MTTRDIVVIGASAGGLNALTRLISALPSQLHASIFVVVHFPAHGFSKLPAILNRSGQIPAIHPAEGEEIRREQIYVAPPDHHLLIKDGHVSLYRGPRQNGFRPSIDVLFRSAARTYGPRTLGILLSGLLDDGVFGLQAIQRYGGLTIVQEPEEAEFDALPLTAIQTGVADQVLPVQQIANLILQNSQPAPGSQEGNPMPEQPNEETEAIESDIEEFEASQEEHTAQTVLTCPECGGLLWETREGEISRYRCHVGHVYSTDSMLEEQSRAIENTLWTAVRTLRERAFMLRRLAGLAQKSNAKTLQQRYLEQAREYEEGSDLIRKTFLDNPPHPSANQQTDPPPGG